MSAPLVSVRGLRVGYRRRRRSAPAVRGVDLDIRRGETVALVGESGSGKTTIAAAVIGLLPDNATIDGGSVIISSGGQTTDVLSAKESRRQGLRGRVVGLIPQDPMVGLNPTVRIGPQVAEAVRGRGVTDRVAVDQQVLDYLRRAGISDPELRAAQYPHQLSGGLRQRVLIAIALAGEPELIIADEPTSALDVTVQATILDHLESLVRDSGIALLIITHDLAVAADRSDRVVVLQQGEIVEQGAPGDILVAPRESYTRRLIAAAPGLAHAGRIVPRYTAAEAAADGDAPILTLTEVSKQYRLPGRESFAALDQVSVTVPRGRTHALVGESGSGKTTTARIALGLERADGGRVVLDGTDITDLSWRRTRPLRRRVQLVHQNPFASLDPRFTVGQSITEPLVSFRVGNRRSRALRAIELLDQVALPAAYADRLPRELSGGQRQRVAIARALALEPDLVLLDEPVSALDVSVQQQILELLTDLQTRLGLSYLFISHDLSVVAQVSHSVSVLSRGRVVESGAVADVFGQPRSTYTQQLIAAIPGQRAASLSH